MDDLISRAAALDAISTDGGCGMCARRMLDIPAVDAAPVKRGRWKSYSVPHWTKRYDDNGDPEYKYHNEYVCSICRRRTIVCENYCPACGARMGSGADER